MKVGVIFEQLEELKASKKRLEEDLENMEKTAKNVEEEIEELRSKIPKE